MAATVFYESSAEAATVRNVFKVATVATDPTTVSLSVTTPSGVTTTYTYAASEITKNGTGDYQKLIACSEDGDWLAVWTGTGAAADVQEVRWQVFKAADKLYSSVESLKSRFQISDAVDDYELERAVRAASRRVESYCGRERFWRDATVQVRTFQADSVTCCRVPVGISTTTGLVVKTDEDNDGTYERTLTLSTDFVLRPSNAASRNPAWPYDEIHLADNYSFPLLSVRDGVQVTARFGWPEVPDDIREAALILSHRLFKRKETATGVVGFDGLGATVRLSRTDPDVAELLSPYRSYGME